MTGPLAEWLLAWLVTLRRDEMESLVHDHLEIKLLYPKRYKLDNEIEEKWFKHQQLTSKCAG